MQPSKVNELEEYLKLPQFHIDVPAIVWWQRKEVRRRWRNLLQMAIDVLFAQLVSDVPERAFSSVKQNITDQRNRLSDEIVGRRE
jgi:hypothetical protein